MQIEVVKGEKITFIYQGQRYRLVQTEFSELELRPL
jgi:hypothetical protein